MRAVSCAIGALLAGIGYMALVPPEWEFHPLVAVMAVTALAFALLSIATRHPE